jgi:16S rRNA (cytosine967-C5)-methyltransferase
MADKASGQAKGSGRNGGAMRWRAKGRVGPPKNKGKGSTTGAGEGDAQAPKTRQPEPPGLGARRLAVRLIDAILGSRRTLDDALESADRDASLAMLEPRDRGFARLIAATVLRRKGSLEHVLAGFLERPLPATATRPRAILLAAAAQILLLNTPVHAAINLAVEQCRRDPAARRYDKLANAVLRRVAAEGKTLLAAHDAPALDVPPWLLAGWRAAYGPELARDIASASLAEAPLDLSLLPAADKAAWADGLGGDVLATGSLRLVEHGRVEELDGYHGGSWWVQDAAAALPSKLIAGGSGLHVADLCAAPGGKTAALASRGYRVTAVDMSPERLERLAENLARLEIGGLVETVAADILNWEPGILFDAVLLDAPCTATGTIRRHPDILHLKREQDVRQLAKRQRQLIERAARLVKPGGTLVYCVCSLEPQEGPEIVNRFLAGDRRFSRVPVRPDEIGGDVAKAWITPEGDLRTLPCHDPRQADRRDRSASGMDGFFAARLRRAEG